MTTTTTTSTTSTDRASQTGSIMVQTWRLATTRQPTRRGYSLPFVLLILILLSVSLASLLFVLTTGARSTESMLGRRRLFYACDGLSRIAAVSAQNYFAQTDKPSSEGLRAFVCGEGGGCVADGATGASLPTFMSQTPGHEVTKFELSQVDKRRIAPLDSGPFEGMMAMQDNVEMKVEIKKSTAGWKCDVTQELALAKISMFQFFIFSDQAYTDWAPGPDMAGDGRVHANGDLCFFSLGNELWVDRVTASGRVSPGGETKTCRTQSASDNPGRRNAPRIGIRTAPVFDTNTGNIIPIEPDTTHFKQFTERSTTLSTWLTESAKFKGHLQDEAHRVVNLRLPVLGSPAVQQGTDASLKKMDNTTTRLLVDPIVPGEPAAISAQRFAYKADIRIVNGVWYKRVIASPTDIGEPIWSDHAGKVARAAENVSFPAGANIGQDDIFDGVTVSDLPKRYSYYRFDEDKKLLTTTPLTPAVVSYGLLAREPGPGAAPTKTPLWKPGVYCTSAPFVWPIGTTGNGCSGSLAAQLFESTRSGFRDGHAQARFKTETSNSKDARANVLPMNIDVAAFQDALGDCRPHELGSHFPGTCGTVGRKFNGIVYVTNTWPDAHLSPPLPPPAQGTRGGANATPTEKQVALPEPLCVTTASPITAVAGALTQSFVSCTSYQAPSFPTGAAAFTSLVGARPTAVRLHNMRSLNANHSSGRPTLSRPGILENGIGATGLTIASNLPVYTLGDVNMASVPGGKPWVPFLVAGDVVSILSNNWDDARARWQNDLSDPRDASETRVNMEMLAGWTPTTDTAYSGGLHNFPRFLEDWGTIPLHIRGSLVVGWSTVYARWKRRCCDTQSYQAPERDWGYDTNLEDIQNQPPGAPLFDVQATRRWTR